VTPQKTKLQILLITIWDCPGRNQAVEPKGEEEEEAFHKYKSEFSLSLDLLPWY
jgi:hypothetical protein